MRTSLFRCCLQKTHSGQREYFLERLEREGIGFGRYFDPHLADQSYFRELSVCGELKETARIANQIISLPLSDSMTLRM